MGKDLDLTLTLAGDNLLRTRWRGVRDPVGDLSKVLRLLSKGWDRGFDPARVTLKEAGARLPKAVSKALLEGMSPASINRAIMGASALGVPNASQHKVGYRPPVKWWLTPDDESKALAFIREERPDLDALADYILWATATGLRVEETIRVQARHFFSQSGPGGSTIWALNVPGTKTVEAAGVVVLSPKAAEVFLRRLGPEAPPEFRLFPLGYVGLHRQWQPVRKFLGQGDNPTATLKAFRRSAARAMHVDAGMPLHVVADQMRHRSVATTEGYLRLTGGYSVGLVAGYYNKGA